MDSHTVDGLQIKERFLKQIVEEKVELEYDGAKYSWIEDYKQIEEPQQIPKKKRNLMIS